MRILGILLSLVNLLAWAQEAPPPTAEEIPIPVGVGREIVELKMISLPKYEWGMGGGVFVLPHYPGSDQTIAHSLVLPYFVYRGDALKVDRQGRLRTDFFSSEQYDIDVSVSGAFASNSEDNEARQGMEDLDWMLEVGPRLVLHLLPSRVSFKATLDLNLPIRWVVSTDFGRVDHRGFTFTPNLIYRHPDTFIKDLTLILSGTMTYATEALQDYFYEVPFEFAKPSRPEFDASGGYMSTSALLGFGYRWDNDLLVFIGGQASYYDGAINSDSPLLRSLWGYSYGIGLAWKFYESDEMSSVTFDPEDY